MPINSGHATDGEMRTAPSVGRDSRAGTETFGGRRPAPVLPSSCRAGQAPRRRRHLARPDWSSLTTKSQAVRAMSSHAVPSSRTVTPARPPGVKSPSVPVISTAVDEQHRMSSVAVGKRGLRGRQTVVRHACRPAVVDGIRMLMVRQPFQPIPVSCGERIDGSRDAQISGAVHHRQLAYHRPKQALGRRRVSPLHCDRGDLLECERYG